LLLQARALAESDGLPAATAARRSEAVAILSAAIKARPSLVDAYHLLAEVQVKQGDLATATATLGDCLKAAPDDAVGLEQLVVMVQANMVKAINNKAWT